METELKKKKVLHLPSWSVAEEVNSLPEVPFLHIPSTTYTIVNEANPRVVATRLVDAIAAMSAIGNYNDKKAIATIYTITDVKLSIQFFKHDNKILVEVHRLSGDAIQYHYTAKSILQIANNQAALLSRQRFKPTVTVTPHRGSSPRSQIHTSTTNENSTFARTMENVQTLLRKDRIDANVLGMESLQLLTNISSSNLVVAREASKAVLIDGTLQDIKNVIFGTVMDDHSILDLNQDTGAIATEHGMKLKLALTIIGNALNVVVCSQKDHDVEATVVDVEEMKDLIVALKKLMEESGSSSSNSNASMQVVYQAARCLNLVTELSSELKRTAARQRIADVAMHWLEGNASRHQLLQKECEILVSCLGEIKKQTF